MDSRKHSFSSTMPLRIKNATPDAPSARKMRKSPKLDWTSRPGGPKMRDTVLADGSIQSFYYPEDHPTMPGWFKGMQAVLEERGLF